MRRHLSSLIDPSGEPSSSKMSDAPAFQPATTSRASAPGDLAQQRIEAELRVLAAQQQRLAERRDRAGDAVGLVTQQPACS